jgi:quinol monooxygenase YgiN
LLVLAGTAQIDPARRDDVIAAAVETMKRARTRTGCISFVCSADLEDPNLLHVFLEWETAEGLFALLTAERVAAFRQNAEKLGVRDVSVARYEIKSVGPIV